MSGTLSGTRIVGSGAGGTGSDSGTTVTTGGLLFVGYDHGVGTASDTTLIGGTELVGDANGTGYATSTTISAFVSGATIVGGLQYVGVNSGSGHASATVIFSGGAQAVGEEGGAGTAEDTTISAGGTQFVGHNYGSGAASGTVIAGGEQYIGANFATGSATDTTIGSGGAQFVGYEYGTGAATKTEIGDGGAQWVGAYGGTGSAIDATIDSGGAQYLACREPWPTGGGYLPGGVATATSTTVLSGGVQYVGGAFAGEALQLFIPFGGGSATASATTIDGAQYVAAGGDAIGDVIESGGFAEIFSGGLVDGALIDGGELHILSGATVKGSIGFSSDGAHGVLDLTGATGGAFAVAVSGFSGSGSGSGSGLGSGSGSASSDLIAIKGAGAGDHLVWTQNAVDSGTLDALTSDGALIEEFTLVGAYQQANFALNVNGGVDDISYSCFLAGTRIRTPDGETAIEDLAPGDAVLTASGAIERVHWVGRQTVDLRFADPLRARPIRIHAGALGDAVPSRDLLLSPDHALFIDGALVHAGCLVNGDTIRQDSRGAPKFVYYHLELDHHALILAENTPAESFIDNADRMNFDNWAEFEALYPEGKQVAELPFPRVKSARQMPAALRQRFWRRQAG